MISFTMNNIRFCANYVDSEDKLVQTKPDPNNICCAAKHIS